MKFDLLNFSFNVLFTGYERDTWPESMRLFNRGNNDRYGIGFGGFRLHIFLCFLPKGVGAHARSTTHIPLPLLSLGNIALGIGVFENLHIISTSSPWAWRHGTLEYRSISYKVVGEPPYTIDEAWFIGLRDWGGAVYQSNWWKMGWWKWIPDGYSVWVVDAAVV